MFKIAILGCENTHADRFLSLIHDGVYPDIEVVGIYSCEAGVAQKLADKYGVKALDEYESLKGNLDGVMITARHGDNHYKYAKTFMDDGIPMFIDKPITISEAEAVEFMTEAKKKNVRFCGGSTCAFLDPTLALKESFEDGSLGDKCGGNLVCPIHIDSPYGGFFFYAQHLTEVMMTVFGYNVKSVTAFKRENRISFVAEYPDFDVTATYMNSGYYQVTVYGSKSQRTEILTIDTDSFRHEMNDMHDLLIGKDMKKTYSDFVKPVFVINAIWRSALSGKKEEIVFPEI